MSAMLPPAVAAIVGLLSGTHAAIWGMYKDAPHEGFALARFTRSIIIGPLCAVMLHLRLSLPTDQPGALVLLFGLAYAAERGIVEVWKTFVRDEDQSKYYIPMQFSIHGEAVKNRSVRLMAGAAYVAAVALCLLAIAGLDRGKPTDIATTVLVGCAVGMIIAAGGSWKDAPKEGFDTLKFLRSPALAVAYAVLLARFTDSYLLMATGAIGFERASAETYKTFFRPSTPRGKFTGMPVTHTEMFAWRRRVVPVYIAIWAAVVVSAVLALRDPGMQSLAGRGP